jgi:hypothetical protein
VFESPIKKMLHFLHTTSTLKVCFPTPAGACATARWPHADREHIVAGVFVLFACLMVVVP